MKVIEKKQSLKQQYTYADYLTWNDDKRWEIIDGEVYDMSPAPRRKHQFISSELVKQIGVFIDKSGSPCQVYHAPFDVRFPEGINDNNKIIDVVQPDIVVICNPSMLDDAGCQGSPDFIIEILSPYTAYKDFTIKMSLYEKNGVREYWIIDPSNQMITVYLLENNNKFCSPIVYPGKGKLKVKSIEDIEINLDPLFS